ncbi:MAG: anhydro-N-acetylmuramic acid kinase [Pseudomonadota bacterium]
MRNDKTLTAIGLMSGTSLDGIDVALVETDGNETLSAGPSLSVPYEPITRATVIRATKAALEGREEAKDILEASNLVTTAHIEAVRSLMEKNRLRPADVDVIGFHGQTILHRPPVDATAPGRTWQIGLGHVLAQELKIDVVDQFRQSDMAAGGQGAPLAPIYHAALTQQAEATQAVAILNLGGVGNVTYVPAGGDPMGLIAFDCGPGNGLIDQWVYRHTGAEMDEGGMLAASGEVDEEAVALMALNPFVRQAPPKSLDRYDFKMGAVDGLSVADGAATLTAFTAECVARSANLLPEPPAEWIVCGGGRLNPILMAQLKDRVEASVVSAEERGWRGDMIEAECFGYLAVRSLKKMPLSFPLTTGVPRPMTGGQHHRAPVSIA